MAGNKKKDPVVFGYYFVAFVDILNQKEVLRKIKELPSTEEGKQNFFQLLFV
jgi:hypothetical protein